MNAISRPSSILAVVAATASVAIELRCTMSKGSVRNNFRNSKMRTEPLRAANSVDQSE